MTYFSAPLWCGQNAGDASSLTEVTLVEAAQAGQDWAFVELCYRHSKPILFTLYKITKNRRCRGCIPGVDPQGLRPFF